MNNQELLKDAINLHLSGKSIEATKIYKKILTSEPSNLFALNNFASLLNTIGKYKEAKKLLNRALSIKPDYFDALNNLGISLKLSKEYLEAVRVYEVVLKLKPNFIKALINFGNCLQSLKKFEEALDVYDKALNINPNSVEVLYNQATCFNELNFQDKAANSYNKVLMIKPDFIEAKWNLAFLQLLQGKYVAGWQNYEIRKKREKTKKNYSNLLENKNWLGKKKLVNKTIYILSEQGLGDYIQFCRYLPMLKNLGAKIILDTPKVLDNIIRTLNVPYIHKDDLEKLEYDYNCLLMSLPLAFNTLLKTIPNKVPYLFAPIDKKNYWVKKLGPKSVKRIGLMWSGNPLNYNDHNRSIYLEKLKKLFDLPFEFHSLQIDYNKFDLRLLKNFKNLSCHKDEVIGFDNAAGLIDSMDLIISVDTSIAHLSGALNKPVWLLLPFTPDFRWLLNRDDSPWYPSMKLYRQTKKNNWDTVIKKIAEDLQDLNF